MRVALLGVGRIGRLHARLLAATPGHRRARHRRRRRRRAPAEVAAEVGATARRRRSTRLSTAPMRSSSPRPPTPTRELIRASIAARQPDRSARSRSPATLDETIALAARDRGARASRSSSASSAASTRPTARPAGWSRSGSSARCTPCGWPATTRRRRTRPTSRPVGRAVPRLLDPRLRRPPLADRRPRSTRSTPTAACGASRSSRSTTTSTRRWRRSGSSRRRSPC